MLAFCGEKIVFFTAIHRRPYFIFSQNLNPGRYILLASNTYMHMLGNLSYQGMHSATFVVGFIYITAIQSGNNKKNSPNRDHINLGVIDGVLARSRTQCIFLPNLWLQMSTFVLKGSCQTVHSHWNKCAIYIV